MNLPAPFSENQYAFFNRCFDSWFSVAEGGKRGGKNVLITMAYCAILEKHPARIHLVAGVSTATARLNILDCDGYGMLNFFEGRCRMGQYQNRDCLYVGTPTGEKIVLVSGGGKNGDEKLIKGNTYGTAYITEANECSKAFIQEVFDRTLSSPDRKVFHDLNPKAEGHWYYTDVLDFHEEQKRKNPAYGYNYGHFTIADNMSLSEAQLRAVLRTYDKGSVWYERDIKGNRKNAEGLVYSFSEANITDETPAGGEYYLSCDYGTLNPFSAGLWCVNGDKAVRIREYYYDGRKEKQQKTDEEYYSELEALADGLEIEQVIVDPSAASFIETIRRHGKFNVRKANNDLINGIITTARMLKDGDIKIHRSCENSIREFGLYSWDDKQTEDNPVKKNDHAMDDIRYFCHTVLRYKYGDEPLGPYAL